MACECKQGTYDMVFYSECLVLRVRVTTAEDQNRMNCSCSLFASPNESRSAALGASLT